MDNTLANTLMNLGAGIVLAGIVWIAIGYFEIGGANIGIIPGALAVTLGIVLIAYGDAAGDEGKIVDSDDDDEYRY